MLYRKIFVFLFFILSTDMAMATHSERHQTVNGMSIYFGALPAQIIQDHEDMHGGNENTGKYTYHIVIALFDSKTGKRIMYAKVKATVIPLGMKGVTKKLEPMHANLKSYGNYFVLHNAAPYTIRVEIQRSGSGKISIAEFTFTRPRD